MSESRCSRKGLENRYGGLPPTPEHHFIGRSRELLKLERLLALRSYAVLCGQGGEGKTTLAVELARWLVRTRRFGRVGVHPKDPLSHRGNGRSPRMPKWAIPPQ